MFSGDTKQVFNPSIVCAAITFLRLGLLSGRFHPNNVERPSFAVSASLAVLNGFDNRFVGFMTLSSQLLLVFTLDCRTLPLRFL